MPQASRRSVLPPARGAPRRSGPDAVRVQSRELGPLRRGGHRRCSACSRPAIRSETDELRAQGVRIRLLGRLDELPEATRTSIGEALEATAGGTRLLLNIAFNYAGRTELVDAFRRSRESGIATDEIDEGTIGASLYTAGLPDPDLVIRTGGEQRLSNFLIWQSAYAEFYFTRGPAGRTSVRTPSTLPLLEFASRHRRFGR